MKNENSICDLYFFRTLVATIVEKEGKNFVHSATVTIQI